MPEKQLKSRERIEFSRGEPTWGLTVFREIWTTPQGEEVRWQYGLPSSVTVLAITEEGKIVVVGEFQPGLGTNYPHLVGETMEIGELPEETAKRGLLEETGYAAGSMEPLTTILENTSRSERLIHLFLARNCKRVAESEEDIRITLMDPDVFWDFFTNYILTNPEKKHGGTNSLKAMCLAFWKLGWLKLNIDTGKEV